MKKMIYIVSEFIVGYNVTPELYIANIRYMKTYMTVLNYTF